MPVEGGGVELSEDVDLVNAGVDAVAHRHVNQAVGPSNWHSGLCTVLGQRVQAGSRAAPKDDCTYRAGISLLHDASAGCSGPLGNRLGNHKVVATSTGREPAPSMLKSSLCMLLMAMAARMAKFSAPAKCVRQQACSANRNRAAN